MPRHLTTLNLEPFMRSAIGFDQFFENMAPRIDKANVGNYPPYNIIAFDDDHYVVELAVAGFSKDDIQVIVHDGQLLIEGAREKDTEEQGAEYLHRGIGARSFSRSFALADHVEAKGASTEDGILRIELERKVPESLKPKQIEVK